MNNKILVFGDSITWGAWDSEGGWVTRLKKYTDKQAIEGKEDYDEIYPLGISGDNSDGLLKRFEVELISRLYEGSDIHLIIAVGINDSQFELPSNENMVSLEKLEQNLTEIINIASPHVGKIVLMGLIPVDDSLMNSMPWDPEHGYSNEHVKKYDSVLRKFALKNNLVFMDLYDLFQKREHEKLLSDGLHPNDEGHELIYEQVLAELRSMKLVE